MPCIFCILKNRSLTVYYYEKRNFAWFYFPLSFWIICSKGRFFNGNLQRRSLLLKVDKVGAIAIVGRAVGSRHGGIRESERGTGRQMFWCLFVTLNENLNTSLVVGIGLVVRCCNCVNFPSSALRLAASSWTVTNSFLVSTTSLDSRST